MTSSARWAQAVPLLAVLGSVVALGIGTSFAKQLFPQVGSLGTTALRVGFSALLLLLIWRPWRWPLSRADARSLLRYGVALGCMNLMFYQSLQSIPFGVAVAIEFSGPLAVAMFSSRKPVDFIWLALAVLGLGLLLPLGHDVASLDPTGVGFALGAAACWAAYIVFGKRVGHLHAGHSVALGLSVAALTVVPFGIWHAGSALLDPQILLFGLGVAAVSSAIPISLEMVALKRLPQEAFGIMTSLEPAVAALMGLMLLGEHLTGLQWLAIACTMLAAAGSSVTAGHEPPRQAADEIVM
ncbi:DMT family transporter [Hydrogenophaga sp.]|jgi:inner membrane transporter RhtA|uniref:EamA family transporter n=1 Tax=Hydrogenophaga sp. TaxID=1904254 RepID=UPI002720AAEC|nr:DMT family transporter [Hydrogenophaga sp.]MDO9253098.1 DMT family transporter [Hydrogenophaga sp.]MDP2404697.1 DMT family transporter [Hydrogenophaga sp.]MDP3322171.1 DMT family transporter [Hydrogenophaga sp.]MDP3886010.1 DMT family transporter [Hydrogenophaga sp.]MDZ4176501.1 DMT family transporter [Hydrogenophaga sp.]